MGFPTVEELEHELAQHNARVAEDSRIRWEGCLDEAPGSHTMNLSRRHEIEERLRLARDGYRTGFVGLCRLDGTTATGRWIDSKWRGKARSWGTPKPDGTRGLAFISGDLLLASRGVGPAAVKANAKLRALGFQWESRRLRAWAETRYPESKRGWEGVFYGRLCTYPVDRDGNELCPDGLVYPADEFFCLSYSGLTPEEEYAVLEQLHPA